MTYEPRTLDEAKTMLDMGRMLLKRSLDDLQDGRVSNQSRRVTDAQNAFAVVDLALSVLDTNTAEQAMRLLQKADLWMGDVLPPLEAAMDRATLERQNERAHTTAMELADQLATVIRHSLTMLHEARRRSVA